MPYYKIKRKGSSAKQTAWKNFSDYIRLRDCLKTTGSADYCKCVTCGEIVPYAQIQSGHAISGRTNGILFDEDIVRGQCVRCNCGGGGETQAFKRVLVDEHGEAWYQMKVQARKNSALLTDDQYRLISKYFLTKRKKLQEGT